MREWDAWSRRWQDEVDRVSQRCGLGSDDQPGARALADALDGIEGCAGASGDPEPTLRKSAPGEDALTRARSGLKLLVGHQGPGYCGFGAEAVAGAVPNGAVAAVNRRSRLRSCGAKSLPG